MDIMIFAKRLLLKNATTNPEEDMDKKELYTVSENLN